MRKHILFLVLIFTLVAALGASTSVRAAPTELFFSEYIEGSSNNKALEIYNGTGVAVDLAAGSYNVQMFFNGNPSAGLTINLTGSVADGDVYVLAHSSAVSDILSQADQTNGAGWFNGNDAVVLRKGTTIIDVIGQTGFDPGSEWGSGLTSTADNTLRRKPSIEEGDTNPSDAFDPSVEWDGFAQNTFDGLGCHAASCDSGTPDVKISEIRIDQPGDDNDEYFELVGAPGTSLNGLTYLVIGDGSSAAGSGVIEEVTDLTGQAISSSGFFVAAESTFSLGTANQITDLNFENSDNVTHLLVSGFTGINGNDLDTNDDGVLDVTPWSELVDLIALVEEANPPSGTEYHYGPPSVGPDGTFVPGHAFLCENGWRIGAFDPSGGDDTPGAENACADDEIEIGNCGESATFIHDIQGSGATSSIVGETVIIEGVVVGDFQAGDGDAFDSDLGGFFVQEEDGDADTDPLTSEGIFVLDGSSSVDVALGDVVRVQGTVAESFSRTQLGGVTGVVVCSSGISVTPATVTLPVNNLNDLEAYEGMSVVIPQTLNISEYFNFDRFGEIVLTTDRQFQPTAVFEPGSTEAANLAQAHLRSRITLDDGRSSQNPDPAIHPNGQEFTLANRFRGGDTVQNVTGVMDFAFGLYRIQPTEGADYASANPRPAAPENVGGSLKVSSFNVLNYFLTIDTGAFICGPAQNQECRGADTPEEFERQRAKIIAALAAINADIFGLIEMENTTGVEPLEDIVAGLNDELGAGTYAYIDTGTIGGDAIKVGIIYKPGTVTPVGDFAILDSTEDPRFLDELNRPVLAQTFMENASGGVVTVAVNHLKSKGSPCDDVGDPDLGDGQGNCNVTRTNAAEALVDWLASDPTESGDADFLITGDLNAYDKEDPIDAIREGADDSLGTGDDYTDLIFQYQGEFAYSFVFDGQLGYLDHALASTTLAAQVTGATEWHINADEPDILDYDTSFKLPPQDALFEPNAFRSSDHDPVIVGLQLKAYDFTGFFAPVENPPVFNEVNAGSSVPIKFSLDGDKGLDILAPGFPQSQQIDCLSALPVNGAASSTASNSGLTYDPAADQYVYVWKTEMSWAGTCRQFTIHLDDGSVHELYFEFK